MFDLSKTDFREIKQLEYRGVTRAVFISFNVMFTLAKEMTAENYLPQLRISDKYGGHTIKLNALEVKPFADLIKALAKEEITESQFETKESLYCKHCGQNHYKTTNMVLKSGDFFNTSAPGIFYVEGVSIELQVKSHGKYETDTFVIPYDTILKLADHMLNCMI